MSLQEMIEFAVRLSVNAGRTKEEAWILALQLTGVRP